MATSGPDSIRVSDRRTLPFAIISSALFEVVKSPFEIAAYAALASFAHDHKAKNLRRITLAKRAKMSERKMMESLRSLEQRRLILTKPKHQTSFGKKRVQLANEYVLLDIPEPETPSSF